MCGRVRLPEDYSELKIDLRLHEIVPHIFAPRWNVPPTEMLPVITSKDGLRRARADAVGPNSVVG
jgi:putative SOS response-associated peptidase YedK